MAQKFSTGPREKVQKEADAIDRENGLLDADGNRTPRPARIFRGGVEVTGDPEWDPNARGQGVVVGTHSAVGAIHSDAGPPPSSCLELDDESPGVAPHLGKNMHGVQIPTKEQLTPFEGLPPGLQDKVRPPQAGGPGGGGPPDDDPPSDPEPEPCTPKPKHHHRPKPGKRKGWF